ncbi:hypothetical protein EZV61_04410 [Corallincola luteus]|uniref:DUF4184 family protein n=1 Tax=Corallincola luteus TaxID=1775177 RepID=A0ABY2ASG4_9GAMM|nr:hypothetical protein [Corallincola luteus]TCI05211.1 hypothetical protein EZV61_04410 [Corallincola luteus]
MPFTPFHMGPGLLIKALFQGSFSLMVFGWSQIVMDIQPLIVLLTGEGHLHGFSHTLIGASLLSTLSCVSGKYLGEWGLRLLALRSRSAPHLPISWPVAATSAAIGCYSHVLLDALMHGDLQPWWPISLENPILGMISAATLHQACLYAGLLGTAGLVVVNYWQKRSTQ